MTHEIESASGLTAFTGTAGIQEPLDPPVQAVAIGVAPAGEQAALILPALSRWRNAVWQEEHAAFRAPTTVVDPRCGGNPIGNRPSRSHD